MKEKEWVKILKTLGNEKRLAILKLLSRSQNLTVGDLASEIRLSFKSTSKHLIRMSHLNLLESEGRGRQVRYSMRQELPAKIRAVIKEILS